MNYISPNFNVRGKHRGNRVFLTQEIKHPVFNTRNLSKTALVLENLIPTIFENKCFNDKNLPFKNEVLCTEVGHLFEHLIIENLKLLSEDKYGTADFSGVTVWNFKKSKKKNFRITISSRNIEEEMFLEAFNKAVQILEKIYDSTNAKSGKIVSRPLVTN